MRYRLARRAQLDLCAQSALLTPLKWPRQGFLSRHRHRRALTSNGSASKRPACLPLRLGACSSSSMCTTVVNAGACAGTTGTAAASSAIAKGRLLLARALSTAVRTRVTTARNVGAPAAPSPQCLRQPGSPIGHAAGLQHMLARARHCAAGMRAVQGRLLRAKAEEAMCLGQLSGRA